MKTLKLKIINFFTKRTVSHNCEEHYKIVGIKNIFGNSIDIPVQVKCKICGNTKIRTIR